MRGFILLLCVPSFFVLGSWSCKPPSGEDVDHDGAPEDAGLDTLADSQDDSSRVDAESSPNVFITLRGTVWSPGADLSTTLENNRFPLPGAAVIAYTSPPPEIPQGQYCNECVEIPVGTMHTLSDPVDGTFELQVIAGRTYYLTIQKGEFRRVREYTAPDTPGVEVDLDGESGEPRPEAITLPSRTDGTLGDNVPKIAMIKGSWEDMETMFTSLGFDYDHNGLDFDIYCAWDPFGGCPGPSVGTLLGDSELMAQYNLIIVTCGEDFPGGNSTAIENLREWVRNGGSLYVDDFNYDFVEQPWPDFLAWYIENTEDMDDFDYTGPCGTEDHPSYDGDCNDWDLYDFNGSASDVPDFAAWLELPEVNRGQSLRLYGAYDYLYELGEGEVGIDEEFGSGPNNEYYRLPKVWMYNVDSVPFGNSNVPATVSWPFYCGKVLYTVYHTHGTGDGPDYELMIQEKIMLYLIMEIQTCASNPVLY